MNTLTTKDTMSTPISTYVNRYLMARSRFNPTMERGIRLARMIQSAGFSGAVLRLPIPPAFNALLISETFMDSRVPF